MKEKILRQFCKTNANLRKSVAFMEIFFWISCNTTKSIIVSIYIFSIIVDASRKIYFNFLLHLLNCTNFCHSIFIFDFLHISDFFLHDLKKFLIIKYRTSFVFLIAQGQLKSTFLIVFFFKNYISVLSQLTITIAKNDDWQSLLPPLPTQLLPAFMRKQCSDW